MNSNPRSIGKYELREILGRGGMAEVWKAFDTQLRRYVAVKILHGDLQNDPNFITRFEREAQAIASLSHPNIVQIFDFSPRSDSTDDRSTCYMVMTYVEGQTLASYMSHTSRTGKFLPVGEIIHLFTTIGKAVDYAHEKGMIHRDIKPANILLDQQTEKAKSPAVHTMGEPILSDFGIAKMLGATQTLIGGWLGTPLYVSPEVARGEPGTRASDIYSLGIILYQICTGVLPFQGESIQEIVTQQLNAMPVAPVLLNPHISPALSAVILRSLAKGPEARFSSASALAHALSQALDSSSTLDFNQTQLVSKSGTHNVELQISPSARTIPPITSTPVLPYTKSVTLPASSSPHLQAVTHTPAPAQTETAASNPPPISPETPPPAAPVKPTTRRNIVLGIALLLLILLVVGGSLSAFFLFTPRSIPAGITGHAFFVSSGQLNEQSNQGINDELEVDLQNVPAPDSGKSYYVWLQPDKGVNMIAPILLGTLPVKSGEAHYLYPGDSKHTNLLESTSRLLITEENADITPNIPSPDTSTWHYTAELPQGQSPSSSGPDMGGGMSELSVLAHLRHLLADAPELQKVGLSGGLDIWLFRNTQKILEWAGSARDDWETKDSGLLHRQVVRVLDYLDGLSLVQKDAPGEPVFVTPQLAQIGLLDLSHHQDPSLLYLIDFHLNAMIQSPGFSAEQRQLAIKIDTAIKNITDWLQQVHQDAVQLVTLSQEQLLQPSSLSLLNDMTTQALNAFGGRIDPATGQIQEGVLQVHFNIQHLATFDIKKV
jgi:eukaryotic-like serine/threonine-protein kinase